MIPRTTYKSYLCLIAGTLALSTAMTSCRDHSSPVPISQSLVHPAIQQPAPPAPETDQEKSCHAFVQAFYDEYINSHLKDDKGPAWYDVPKKSPPVLSRQLMDFLNRESAAEEKTGAMGAIDFDPFVNSQDPSEPYLVEQVSVTGNVCNVAMNIDSHLRPELIREGSSWRFTNFHYTYIDDNGKHFAPDDDLIHIVTSAEAREESGKKKGAHK